MTVTKGESENGRNRVPKNISLLLPVPVSLILRFSLLLHLLFLDELRYMVDKRIGFNVEYKKFYRNQIQM